MDDSADDERTSHLHAGLRPLESLDRLTGRPWFPYLMLLLLQLKVMWGVWSYRDLAFGDESGYYSRAFLWFESRSVDLVWSPLYTSFLGTLMHVSPDAYVVTTLHRVLVVLTVDVMVLALMQRLLPAWIAWLIAAWWVLLPVTFDTVSTVHLFAVIPVVGSWLLILRAPSPWARGGAVALLAATTVLVRNEYVAATLALAASCVWWECRMAAARAGPRRSPSRLLAYGLPLLAAAGVVLFFYARAIYHVPELWTGTSLPRYRPPWSMHSGFVPKHTYNMCQVYAFGFQQRHPEWPKNPMLECADLMAATFGTPLPSLFEMLRRNPAATLVHFWWNVSLTPSGLQLLLFDASASGVNPDYFPVTLGSRRALALAWLTIGVLAVGGVLLYRGRHDWWERWLKNRALGWLAMLSTLAAAGLIIPTQRPRPSYLFPQGLLLMALVGMCVFAIARRWPALERLSRALPGVMLLLLLVAPTHYRAEAAGRPLLRLYERLAPFSSAFGRPGTIFLVSGYPLEIHDYVGRNYFASPLLNFDYAILDEAPPDRPLPAFLDEKGINLLYVDEPLWRRLAANPVRESFLASPETAGWTPLARHDGGNDRWMLLRRMTDEPASSAPIVPAPSPSAPPAR